MRNLMQGSVVGSWTIQSIALDAVTLIAAAMLQLFPISAEAASLDDSCKSALIPTQIQQTADHSQTSAMLKIISNQDELDKARNASAGFLGEFKLDASYGDFDKHRTAYLSQELYSASSADASRMVTSFLPPENVKFWLDCELHGQGGVRLGIQNVTHDTFTIRVHYIAPQGISTAKLRFQITGLKEHPGNIYPDYKTKKFSSGFDDTFTLRRIPGKDANVNMSIGPNTDGVQVPATVEPTCLAPTNARLYQDMDNQDIKSLECHLYYMGRHVNNDVDGQGNHIVGVAVERCFVAGVDMLRTYGADLKYINHYGDSLQDIADAVKPNHCTGPGTAIARYIRTALAPATGP